MKSFAARTTIQALPQTIWQILTDVSGYPVWNRTVTNVEGSIALGQTVTVHAKAAPGRAFPVKVVAFEPEKRMVCSGGMPAGLFVGERTFELTPAGSSGVEFAMREVYSGLLAPLITRSIPDLQPAFDEFAACLKQRAETLSRGGDR